MHETLQTNVSVNIVPLALKSQWKIDSKVAGVKCELLSSFDVAIFYQIKRDKSVTSVENMLYTRSYRKRDIRYSYRLTRLTKMHLNKRVSLYSCNNSPCLPLQAGLKHGNGI